MAARFRLVKYYNLPSNIWDYDELSSVAAIHTWYHQGLMTGRSQCHRRKLTKKLQSQNLMVENLQDTLTFTEWQSSAGFKRRFFTNESSIHWTSSPVSHCIDRALHRELTYVASMLGVDMQSAAALASRKRGALFLGRWETLMFCI